METMESEQNREQIEIMEINEDKETSNDLQEYVKAKADNSANSGNDKSKTEDPGEQPEFKMNMDEVMEKLKVPYRKIADMEMAYFLAISTKEQIEETVLKLQALTKVTWSVKQTRNFLPCVKKRPKKPINLFKRQYGCHMSTRTRARTKRLRHKKSRNINCPAQLLVSIKAFVASSTTKPKMIMFDKEFPCVFEFRNHHNHLVNVEEVMTTRPMGEDVKNAIYSLLNKGHSCASAYHTMYTIKVEEFGADYKTKMTDRHVFPRRNDFATIYKVQGFRERYDRFLNFSHAVKNLEEILYSCQIKNGTLYRMSVKHGSIVICLCTPLMQRALQQVSEFMFIDSSGDDCREYRAYFILTQTAVGALPIGCILSNKPDMSAFREGMKLFNDMIEIEPAVVLTNATLMKELVGQNVFPKAKILLSFYHALSSAWKCLYETRHELARAKKESYYQLFREVVFADSEEGLVVARQVLAVECAQPKFLSYIDKMYENTPLWCLYYRQFMDLHGSETFDYNEAELSFRLFRLISKVALDRTRLFNLTHMTDFVCTAFEKFYKNRIWEMALGRKSEVLEERYGRPGSITPPMEDIGHHQYLFAKTVPEILDEYYQVDMITNQCTCGNGTVGKHCEHIAEILENFKVFSPNLTIDQKAAFYYVATGVLKHKNSFLPKQEQDSMEERDPLCRSPKTVLGTKYLDFREDQSASDASPPDLESTKARWMSYCNKIVTLMENDPEQFVPAINVHLDNVKKYSTSVPVLLKGLYAGFPYMGGTDNLPPLAIIQNKMDSGGGGPKGQTKFNANGIVSTTSCDKRSVPPPLINMKQGPRLPIRVDPKSRPPPLTKPFGVNFGSPSNFAMSMSPNSEEDRFSEEDVKIDMSILEEKPDCVVVQRQSETVTFAETVTLNQLSNLNAKPIDFEVEPAHLESISAASPDIFDIEKSIFVNRVTLSGLTQNDVAVLDEKKGILIIPMEAD